MSGKCAVFSTCIVAVLQRFGWPPLMTYAIRSCPGNEEKEKHRSIFGWAATGRTR